MKTSTMLTDQQVAEIRRLWLAGVGQAEITLAAGITIDTLRARLRDQLVDLPPRDRRINSGRRGVDPSAEEIRRAMIEIRKTWPEERWLPPPLVDFEDAESSITKRGRRRCPQQ